MARRYELLTRYNEADEREWALAVQEYSRLRDFVANRLMDLCGVTGHALEEVLHPVWNWAWDRERRLIVAPITEDDAFLVDPKWVTTVKREDRAWDDHDDD